jgi:hypothetical protein
MRAVRNVRAVISDMGMDPNIIFLGGHRKTGTTLLHNLLDGHPALAVYPDDATYFYAYFPVYTRDGFSAEARKKRFERVVFTELEAWIRENASDQDLDVSSLREHFFRAIGDRLADVTAITKTMAAAYTTVQGRQGRPFVLKETSIEIYAGELLAAHPTAKFVHLLRDPRDNYAALKAGVATRYALMGENELATLASMIHRARLGFLYARTNQALFGAERYLVLRFEDLLQDTDATLRRLCEFLGIAYHDSLTVPTRLGHPTRGNSFEHLDFSAISARNVGAWPKRITAEEAQIVEFHFSDVMTERGYNPVFAPKDRAAAAAEFYKWQNYRYFFSDRFAAPAQ